jgi:hypothetical protein
MKSTDRNPRWGAVGLVIVILAILIPIGFLLPSDPPINEFFQLDFDLIINSSTDPGHYEARYSWVANSVNRDVEGTHIQWENPYSDGSVESSGEFSDVIFSRLYHIYVDWTELVIYSNSTWTLSVSIVSYGFTFALTIRGTNTTIIEIVPSIKDVWIDTVIAGEWQEDLGVDELLMSCDVEFHIGADLLEQEFQNQQNGFRDFSDLTRVLNNYTIGTIPLY